MHAQGVRRIGHADEECGALPVAAFPGRRGAAACAGAVTSCEVGVLVPSLDRVLRSQSRLHLLLQLLTMRHGTAGQPAQCRSGARHGRPQGK